MTPERRFLLLGVALGASSIQGCVFQDAADLQEIREISERRGDPKRYVPDAWRGSTNEAFPGVIAWSDFNDPTLDALVREGLESNADIDSALLALQAARIGLRSARAGAAPVFTLGAGGVDLSRSAEGETQQGYSLGATATYQVDLWGRVKNTVALADLSRNGADISLQAAMIAVAQAITQVYFDIRQQDELIRLQEEQIANQQENLRLLRVRLGTGSISRLSVDQLNVAIQRLRIELENLTSQRSALGRTLNLLLGKPSGYFELPSRPFRFSDIPRLSPGSPAEIIFNRTDVALAEQGVAGADISLDSARKAWLPALTVNAASNAGAARLSDLLEQESVDTGVGVNLSFLLLDNGERARGVSEAEINRQQSLIGYEQTLVRAVQEIEQALDNQSRNIRQIEIQKIEQEAQEQVTRAVQIRFENGTASAFDLIRERDSELASRQSRLSNWREGIQTSISMLGALGIDPR